MTSKLALKCNHKWLYFRMLFCVSRSECADKDPLN
jgi:hypothetical protein